MYNRRMSSCFVVELLLALLLFPSMLAYTEEIGETVIYMTEEQALQSAFPDAMSFTKKEFKLTPEQKESIKKLVGRSFADGIFIVHAAFKEKELLGYGVVSEEIGKYRPITYFVSVTPELAVKDVFVLIYRESRGGDVRRKRFLAQYKGKTVKDPIKINKDILNISGATISVRSLNFGVKKALAFFHVFQEELKTLSP